MNMNTVELPAELLQAMDAYQQVFPGECISLFETTLDTEALIRRIERAIVEKKLYDPIEEEWDEEQKKQLESGELLI